MLIAEGTKVELVHTGETGTVTKILDNGMANVQLDEVDMEIPVFMDDIRRLEGKTKVKAKIVPGKQEKIEEKPVLPNISTQYTILKSMGIQLAFDPVEKADGLTSHFSIYLINDTRYDALYDYKFITYGEVESESNGKISAVSVIKLETMLFDQLNDNPTIEMECRQLTTAGVGDVLKKKIKIRAKQFFKKVLTAPLLDRPVHHYIMFEHFNHDDTEKGEDLKDYTKRNIKESKVETKDATNVFQQIDINAVASFRNEIDLHIEKLHPNPKKISKEEILYIQLKRFEDFMEMAIRHDIEKVFIIHGVGKGKLRNEISKRLSKNPNIVSFKNEYHAKYGFGATEVTI